MRASASQPNPHDLLARLATILFAVGVAESATRGLLGDTSKLTVTGDGSPLRTGASKHGKKTCDHPKTERCDCPRIFDDPDARMGFDSYRNVLFHGHHFYEANVNVAHPCGMPAAQRRLGCIPNNMSTTSRSPSASTRATSATIRPRS